MHPVGLSGFVNISIDRGGTGDALNSASSCAAVNFHWAVGSRSINRIFLLASRAMKNGDDDEVMMKKRGSRGSDGLILKVGHEHGAENGR